MERIVIIGYKTLERKKFELRRLAEKHWGLLSQIGLGLGQKTYFDGSRRWYHH